MFRENTSQCCLSEHVWMKEETTHSYFMSALGGQGFSSDHRGKGGGGEGGVSDREREGESAIDK